MARASGNNLRIQGFTLQLRVCQAATSAVVATLMTSHGPCLLMLCLVGLALAHIQMATAREYFEKDAGGFMGIHSDMTLTDGNTGAKTEVVVGVTWDFIAGVKFGRLYVPDIPYAAEVIAHFLTKPQDVLKVADGVEPSIGHKDTSENVSASTLTFSKRINVHSAATIPTTVQLELQKIAATNGLTVLIRDQAYCSARARHEKPEAFISHDTRDKDPFVRKLATILQSMMCSVWYDEFSLVAGQSLRASIEKGLKECKKCVLVLSPNFFSNGGWTKKEFDSIFTREVIEQTNVVIPIWLGVTKQQVYDYSPSLVDKVGIPGNLEPTQICQRIRRAIDLKD